MRMCLVITVRAVAALLAADSGTGLSLNHPNPNNMKNEWIEVEAMRCEMYRNELATVQVTYGLYSERENAREHYKHNLSDRAAAELFKKCHDLIKENLMYWHNRPLPEPPKDR